ncbi:DUF1778 domain-containing protein [Methylobacterium sp.]|uniref:type II toxin-antitoxin system TacA family antitoxin n=1 Tax=Methylobacterium sp. TaxID=409 RepID=UPI0025D71931|nr:DUF1778 domain-containing protein [Methylobacterium sp.]
MARSTASKGAPQAQRARPERLEARITGEQKAMFQRAADLQGRSLTDFVVSSVQEAAKRTIEDFEVIHLSVRDSELFIDALLNPRAPGPKLREAAAWYKQTMGDV